MFPAFKGLTGGGEGMCGEVSHALWKVLWKRVEYTLYPTLWGWEDFSEEPMLDLILRLS